MFNLTDLKIEQYNINDVVREIVDIFDVEAI